MCRERSVRRRVDDTNEKELLKALKGMKRVNLHGDVGLDSSF